MEHKAKEQTIITSMNKSLENEINSLNTEFKDLISKYEISKSNFTLSQINSNKSIKDLKPKQTEFLEIYDEFTNLQNKVITLLDKYFKQLEDTNKNNAKSLIERIIIVTNNIQFKHLNPINIRLSVLESKSSEKRDYYLFGSGLVLGILLPMIYTIIIPNGIEKELQEKFDNDKKEILSKIDNNQLNVNAFQSQFKNFLFMHNSMNNKLDSILAYQKYCEMRNKFRLPNF